MQLVEPQLLRQECFVGGQWVAAKHHRCFQVSNPATGEHLADVPFMEAADVEAALFAADRALVYWRKQTAFQRAYFLETWADLIRQHIEDLSFLLTSEQGKPLVEARAEIMQSAAFLSWFAEEGKRAYGDVIPSPIADKRFWVIRESVGVCAAITPWNFPAAMVARKVSAALAAGCVVVLKPAEQTPLSALALAYLAQMAGLPEGVFNVVTGDPEIIGAVLTSHPLVRKLSFTGSTQVGQYLMAQCAPTLKRISLELGGNAPLIVFDDANLDQAVQSAIQAKFRNSGQTCVCANRLFIQAGIYDRFALAFSEQVALLEVGSGDRPGVVQGPLIDEAAVEKVEFLLHDAIAKGARVRCGGQRHILGGTFFEPTVIEGLNSSMLMFSQEIFGPVAALSLFSEEKEVIELANETSHGLAAYVFTQNISKAWRVLEALDCGMVAINTGLFSSEVFPFGGVKHSGFGREGSRYGLEDYMVIKSVCLGGIA